MRQLFLESIELSLELGISWKVTPYLSWESERWIASMSLADTTPGVASKSHIRRRVIETVVAIADRSNLGSQFGEQGMCPPVWGGNGTVNR